MSVSDLNHFMTYVIEGWMLFSAGFISTTFVSFVSRRIQEDLEAAALAEGVSGKVVGQLAAAVTEEVNITENVGIAEVVEATVEQTIAAPEPLKAQPVPAPSAQTPPAQTPPAQTPSGRENDEAFAQELTAEETAEEIAEETADVDTTEAARLEKVAAVSEQLAKNRGKQSDSSSVSVST
ncbi:MAG: hypothetical protein ABG776_13950 [Cyanobacteria bacterium J06555_13]